jgi:hypothetical protein
MTRNPEQGSAILIVMIIIVALLGGGAALLSTQLKATRSTELTKTSAAALHCAEAGLAAARAAVASNYGGWNTALRESVEPEWLESVSHDLDGDGVADFTVALRDNEDEIAPQANDKAQDNDLAVFVVATCIKYPEITKQVSELVLHNGTGTCYESQLGGCGANGNSN